MRERRERDNKNYPRIQLAKRRMGKINEVKSLNVGGNIIENNYNVTKNWGRWYCMHKP